MLMLVLTMRLVMPLLLPVMASFGVMFRVRVGV